MTWRSLWRHNFNNLKPSLEKLCSGGARKLDIAKVLEGAGWTTNQIASALDSYSDAPFPVPVPKPRPSLSAREAFLYLLMFSTLYYGAWNLGSLLFIFINRAFPDPSDAKYVSYWDDQRWSTAAVIIAFPVFLFMARYISQEIKRNPLKRLSPASALANIHDVLFLSSATLLGDTTTLIYNLLGRRSTIRFVLKVVVVAAIAGLAFAYYLLDLRTEERE